MAIVYPVIVVPGITASSLRDEYSLPPETVWSVLTKDYVRISLHPNNVRYEVMEPARLKPDQLFEIAYKELIEELRFNLRSREDQPVPVYPFSYDWRQPLELIEDQLADFVNEVIERTKLMRHYHEDGYASDPKVNFVGHSMGGLVVVGYLARRGRQARVAKVATLATPYRGSFEAVIKIATGTANLGTDAPSSREREAARVTPALYHLIPSCAGLTIDDKPAQTDLFDPALWQRSILETLAEYVRLYAVDQKDPKEQAKDLFVALLDAAKSHRARIENFRLGDAGLNVNDWLCVVGADSETRVRLNVKHTAGGPYFQFTPGDRGNKWKNMKDPTKRVQTGDGTVPFPGALPAFVQLKSVVCVTPEDFGYWEVQDRLFASVAGFHGILPNMDMLHRLIVRHFTGRPDPRGNTWGRPAPGVSPSKWKPPMELNRKA